MRATKTTICYRISVLTVLLASLLLTACGGDGGGGSPPPTMTAPSDLRYPTAPAFVINATIAPMTPAVVGQVTSYIVSPGLPAGLSLNPTTGVISGTPTAVAAEANYTVKATNAGGSTTAVVSIVVNGIAPSIAYSSYYGFTANISAQAITPTVSGGAVVTWTITPALPAGLVFDTTNGTISGAPTAAASPSMYTVTAANSAGESKATMTLAIAAAPLLSLGHSSGIWQIYYSNSSLISVDGVGHWLLQAYGSGAVLASGDGACVNCYEIFEGRPPPYPAVNVAGNTAIVYSAHGVEVLSASSGQLLATITGTFSWAQLASDGSYIATGSTTALTAWSPAGQNLLSRSGDYSKALAFSAPGQVQVALGPAGQNAIQTVGVPSGTSSVSPTFQGTFNSWFLDGGRFFTSLGSTVWTYSSAGVQQDITQLASADPFLVGQGNWFWTLGAGLEVYKVGASSSPAFTQPIGIESYPLASGMTIGIPQGDSNQITVIDLSGATPTSTNYTLPIFGSSAYAATSASSWVVGNASGVIFDGASFGGQPRYLALGQALSIAAGTEYFSVATASGEILYFDASTDALVGTINFPSSQLSMSSDGTVLAAAGVASPLQNPPDTNVNVYSLPSATIINTFPFGPAIPVQISLSGSGTVLAMTPSSTSGCDAEAIAVTGGTPIWCATATPNTVQISPNGTLVAASTVPLAGGTTTIYTNGAVTTAVDGWVAGWLDNTRLLAIHFALENQVLNPVYGGSDIFSSSGTNLGAAPIPQIQSLQTVTSDSIYSPQTNTIMSLTTGAPIWASADASCGLTNALCYGISAGAVTGSQVIFSTGTLVLAQPY